MPIYFFQFIFVLFYPIFVCTYFYIPFKGLQLNTQRIPIEFPKNSQRISKKIPNQNPQTIHPKQFPKNSQRIPKEFPKNSKKSPKKFPQKFPKQLPKNCQKIPIKFPKISHDFENITHVNFSITYIALRVRNPFRACFYQP